MSKDKIKVCKSCKRSYTEEYKDENHETGMCSTCFDDSVEDYEERRRARIAIDNEY